MNGIRLRNVFLANSNQHHQVKRETKFHNVVGARLTRECLSNILLLNEKFNDVLRGGTLDSCTVVSGIAEPTPQKEN